MKTYTLSIELEFNGQLVYSRTSDFVSLQEAEIELNTIFQNRRSPFCKSLYVLKISTPRKCLRKIIR